MRTKVSERGFALAVVVFLLFAVVVASATGYAVVSLESDMSIQGGEANEAMQIAEAGLERFFGEHIGIPLDTTVYAIDDGTAVITARRLAPVDSADGRWLWSVRSEGQVLRLPNATTPATAVVQQQAVLHEEPIARTAALITSYANVTFDGSMRFVGNDDSGGGCPLSGENIYGVANRGSVTTLGGGPMVVGAPAPSVSLGSHAAVFDTAGVRWDVLTDPTFPVDYVNSSPGFGPDWPVVRWEGDMTGFPSRSGRGVLIVSGTFRPRLGFAWDGIVLAGELESSSAGLRWWFVDGILIGGLNGGGGSVTWDHFIGPWLRYNACDALSASNALAYFEPLSDTFEEVR